MTQSHPSIHATRSFEGRCLPNALYGSTSFPDGSKGWVFQPDFQPAASLGGAVLPLSTNSQSMMRVS